MRGNGARRQEAAVLRFVRSEAENQIAKGLFGPSKPVHFLSGRCRDFHLAAAIETM
jgi:hypothetical protein